VGGYAVKEPIDQALFEKVGKEFGISGAAASKLYYRQPPELRRLFVESAVLEGSLEVREALAKVEELVTPEALARLQKAKAGGVVTMADLHLLGPAYEQALRVWKAAAERALKQARNG
jgi:hypothetical protein